MQGNTVAPSNMQVKQPEMVLRSIAEEIQNAEKAAGLRKGSDQGDEDSWGCGCDQNVSESDECPFDDDLVTLFGI